MNFIFIGGTFRGLQLLNALLVKNYKPQFAYILKEDDHEVLRYSEELAKIAEKNNIGYSIKKKLSLEDESFIKSEQRDFLIVCGWRTLINPTIKDSLKLGMVAAHDSLLPKYRGFAPLHWAMINGEKETGVTLFLINEGETDSGAIIDQEKVIIEESDYAYDVYNKIAEATVAGYLRFIENYESNQLQLQHQDESKATYTCKRTPEDGKINWTADSKEVLNFIRAQAPPFPGAYCSYNNENYIIHKAEEGKNSWKAFAGSIPGRVISVGDKGIEVMCRKGTVTITLWEKRSTGEPVVPSTTVKSITATLK